MRSGAESNAFLSYALDINPDPGTEKPQTLSTNEDDRNKQLSYRLRLPIIL